MSISMTCPCGKKYRLKDTSAGKKLRCADCGEVLKIPLQDAGDEAELDEFDALPAVARSQGERQTALPPRIKRPSKVKTRQAEPDERDEPAPRKLIQKGWFGSTNGGVLGGLLMIVIAVVWFVGGLAGGRIFFYPPVLLIIGIVAVVKGLVSSE
jgi:hypothetical protein